MAIDLMGSFPQSQWAWTSPVPSKAFSPASHSHPQRSQGNLAMPPLPEPASPGSEVKRGEGVKPRDRGPGTPPALPEFLTRACYPPPAHSAKRFCHSKLLISPLPSLPQGQDWTPEKNQTLLFSVSQRHREKVDCAP